MNKISPYLDPIITYFERLAVSIAVFAGGAAMVHFSAMLSPWPWIFVGIGGIVIFAAMWLAVLTAGDLILYGLKGAKGTFTYIGATLLCIVITVAFIVAGFQAALQELLE